MVIINGGKVFMNITTEIKTYFKNVKDLDINFDNAEVTYLKQGKTNKSYLMDFTNFRLVLRINADNSSDLGINRVNEEIILNALDDISVSPKIIYCDESYKYLIYEYVEGYNLDIKKITKKNKKTLTDLILRYQSVDINLPKFDYYAYLSKYLDLLKKQSKDKKFDSEKLESFLIDLEKFQKADWIPKLVHHDLVTNIIKTNNSFKILDWEYAGNGFSSFDYQSLGISLNNDPFIEELINILNNFWYEIAN